MLAAIIFNSDLSNFTSIGHTPVYWPLLPMLAVFVAGEQWYAAAFVLGLLVVGRTTMVSILPVFAMALWIRARPRMANAIGITLVTVSALLLPFALWDPGTLWYGMVEVYPSVIKAVVWTSPEIQRTIGLTGWLVSHGLQRFVELTQAMVMTGVYLLIWRALRRGAPVLPSCVLALLAFSMTTLWPVYYLYFDVLLLLVSGAFAAALGRVRLWPHIGGWASVLAAVAALVLLMCTIAGSPFPNLDFGTQAGQRALYKGWLMSCLEGDEPAALIWGRDATIAIPRSSRSAATGLGEDPHHVALGVRRVQVTPAEDRGR